MASLRAFVAVELDPKLVQGRCCSRTTSQDGWRRVKWVKAHNLHFTLKFLGEVPVDNLDR